MITITRFSSTDLKTAKQHLSRMPASPEPAPPAADTADATEAAPEPVEPAPPAADTADATEAAPEPVEPASPAADTADAIEAAPVAEGSASPGSVAEVPDSPDDAVSSAAGPSAEVAALVKEMGLKEKRAAYLVDALALVGNRLDRVRQVIVVQSAGAPARATIKGELAYLVDLAGGTGTDRDRRGGRGRGGGGRGGGGQGGSRGPGGGRGGPRGRDGSPPAEEDLTGPFSMDVAAADRKRAEEAERGRRGGRGGPRGRGGGRRGGPGGGRGGPRGPGGPGGGRGGPRGPRSGA